MRIITDTVEMRAVSNDFEQIKTLMQGIHSDLRRLILQLAGTWEGAAARAYLEKLLNQANEILNIINSLESMKNAAQERISLAETVDISGATIVRNAVAAKDSVVGFLNWIINSI